jgi:hypothetical protein
MEEDESPVDMFEILDAATGFGREDAPIYPFRSQVHCRADTNGGACA